MHSALKHDAIVSSSAAHDVYVEKEATKVAKEAANALRQSRKRIRSVADSYVPTWTGKSGINGAPRISKKVRPSFGKSKTTENIQTTSSIINDLNKNRSTNFEKSVDLMSEIQSYLLNQPHQCISSSDLMKKFNDQANVMGIPVFRELLKEIASYSKGEDQDDGVWTLKEEFILHFS